MLLPLVVWFCFCFLSCYCENSSASSNCSSCNANCPIIPHSCTYKVYDKCNCCEICYVQGKENCANDGYICFDNRYCNMVNFGIREGYCINETLDVDAFKKSFNNLDSYGTDFFEALSIGSDIVGLVSPHAGAISNLITKAVKTYIAPDSQEYKALTNIHGFLTQFYETINKKIDRKSEADLLREIEKEYQDKISIKVAVLEDVFKGIAAQKHIVSNETFHKYCTNLFETPPALIKYIKTKFVTNCNMDNITSQNERYRDFLMLFNDFEKQLPQNFRVLQDYTTIKQDIMSSLSSLNDTYASQLYVVIKKELNVSVDSTTMSHVLLTLENLAYKIDDSNSNCFTQVIVETFHFQREKVFNALYAVYEDLLELLLSACLCADEAADSNPSTRQNIIDSAVSEVKIIANHITIYVKDKLDSTWFDGTMKALIYEKLNGFDLAHPEKWDNQVAQLQDYLNGIGSFDFKHQILVTEKFDIYLQRFTNGNLQFYIEIFDLDYADVYISRFRTGIKNHAKRVQKWFAKYNSTIIDVIKENYGNANLSIIPQKIEERLKVPLNSIFHLAVFLHKQRFFADEAQIKFAFADSYIRGYPAMQFSDYLHNLDVADKHKVFWSL